MDPDACFARILLAVEEGDVDDMVAALDDMRDWLRNGGYMPRPQ